MPLKWISAILISAFCTEKWLISICGIKATGYLTKKLSTLWEEETIQVSPWTWLVVVISQEEGWDVSRSTPWPPRYVPLLLRLEAAGLPSVVWLSGQHEQGCFPRKAYWPLVGSQEKTPFLSIWPNLYFFLKKLKLFKDQRKQRKMRKEHALPPFMKALQLRSYYQA